MGLLENIIELQSIAQAGLEYCEDNFDRERYTKLREIVTRMMSEYSGESYSKVKELFCSEIGYPTPKVDTRVAIINNSTVLLVKENNGEWALPGGWVDVNLSVKENAIKEVKEEAGLDVIVDKLVAIQDSKKDNPQKTPYGICKVFFLCSVVGGAFKNNNETTKIAYFSLNNLPQLSNEKSTKKQIEMCFEAYNNKNWQAEFD